MSAGPTGWVETPLASVTKHHSGNGKLIKGKLPSAPAAGLHPAYSASGQNVWVETPEHEGDAIIVSAVGARCGKAFLANGRWSAVANTHVVWPTVGAVDHRWLFALINDEGFWEKGGSAQPFVKVGKTFEREISLPPLAEQRRIVAKLDALTARTTTARAELDSVPALAARYKQAVLEAAFAGKVSADWRMAAGAAGEGAVHRELTEELNTTALPPGWTTKSMADAADNLDGRRIPIKAADRALRRGNYPYYGASGIIDTIDGYLFDGEHLLIGEDGANLVSRSTAIAFPATGKFWVNNHAHILRARPLTTNAWLCRFVNMINLEPFVTGSAQPKLTQAALNKIHLPLPPLEEQAVILERLDDALTEIDRLAAEAAAARRLLDRLDQAILAKAFRGELVPQDPDDEPAAVLLERISLEPAGPPARGRRRTAAAAE